LYTVIPGYNEPLYADFIRYGGPPTCLNYKRYIGNELPPHSEFIKNFYLIHLPKMLT
jgi:hypothetical protein